MANHSTLTPAQKRAAHDAVVEIRSALTKLKYAQERLHKAGLLLDKEQLGRRIYDIEVLVADVATAEVTR